MSLVHKANSPLFCTLFLQDMSEKSGHGIEMLNGKMTAKIFYFAVPLIFCGILQQSFNAADVSVLGHYTDSESMAAAGSNGPVISIIVNLFLGIALGANVVIANYIGQRNNNGIKRCVSTSVAISIISGLLLTLIGYIVAEPVLRLMGAPAGVITLATRYLKIYFIGMPFIMAYNFGSAIMRSMGDTRRPLYSLIAATATNLILDYIFVKYFNAGISGAAWATVLANGVNATIIIYWLSKEEEPYRFEFKRVKIYPREFVKMLRIGVPAGLQGMIFSLSNIFIQATVNSFGSAAIAGSAAALCYESYCYFIISAFNAATIAFVSQNYGAGNYRRCKTAFLKCMALGVLCSATANLTISFFARQSVYLFSTDPEVVSFAIDRIHIALTIQFIACSYEIGGAYMRALGHSVTPMAITIFGTCILRLGWVFIVRNRHLSFVDLISVYPVSWAVTGTIALIAAYIIQKKAFAVSQQKPLILSNK